VWGAGYNSDSADPLKVDCTNGAWGVDRFVVLIFRGSWCQSIYSFFGLSAFDDFLADYVSKSFCFWYLLACSRSQFFLPSRIITSLCVYKPKNSFCFFFFFSFSHRHTRIVCIIHLSSYILFTWHFLSTVNFKHISVISLACNELTSIMWGSLRIHHSWHFCS